MRESNKAEQAKADYIEMGPGRSLGKLADLYRDSTESVPTKHIQTLKIWSTTFGWVAAAEAWDTEQRIIQRQQAEERRQAIMGSGFAVTHERVMALKGAAERLWTNMLSGEGADFNESLMRQFRGLLDDLAKETGGRQQQISHGGNVTIKVVYGTDGQAEESSSEAG